MDSYLQKLQDVIVSASAGMNGEELVRHPEGKWSPAQVLEHLYLTYTGTIKGCERCVQQGRTLARTPTLWDRVRATVVTGLGVLPGRRKAPERATPRGMPVEQVLSGIGPTLAAMDEAISRCEATFGKRTRLMDHPSPGAFNGAAVAEISLGGRHHVKQIWRVRGKTLRTL